MCGYVSVGDVHVYVCECGELYMCVRGGEGASMWVWRVVCMWKEDD